MDRFGSRWRVPPRLPFIFGFRIVRFTFSATRLRFCGYAMLVCGLHVPAFPALNATCRTSFSFCTRTLPRHLLYLPFAAGLPHTLPHTHATTSPPRRLPPSVLDYRLRVLLPRLPRLPHRAAPPATTPPRLRACLAVRFTSPPVRSDPHLHSAATTAAIVWLVPLPACHAATFVPPFVYRLLPPRRFRFVLWFTAPAVLVLHRLLFLRIGYAIRSLPFLVYHRPHRRGSTDYPYRLRIVRSLPSRFHAPFTAPRLVLPVYRLVIVGWIHRLAPRFASRVTSRLVCLLVILRLPAPAYAHRPRTPFPFTARLHCRSAFHRVRCLHRCTHVALPRPHTVRFHHFYVHRVHRLFSRYGLRFYVATFTFYVPATHCLTPPLDCHTTPTARVHVYTFPVLGSGSTRLHLYHVYHVHTFRSRSRLVLPHLTPAGSHVWFTSLPSLPAPHRLRTVCFGSLWVCVTTPAHGFTRVPSGSPPHATSFTCTFLRFVWFVTGCTCVYHTPHGYVHRITGLCGYLTTVSILAPTVARTTFAARLPLHTRLPPHRTRRTFSFGFTPSGSPRSHHTRLDLFTLHMLHLTAFYTFTFGSHVCPRLHVRSLRLRFTSFVRFVYGFVRWLLVRFTRTFLTPPHARFLTPGSHVGLRFGLPLHWVGLYGRHAALRFRHGCVLPSYTHASLGCVLRFVTFLGLCPHAMHTLRICSPCWTSAHFALLVTSSFTSCYTHVATPHFLRLRAHRLHTLHSVGLVHCLTTISFGSTRSVPVYVRSVCVHLHPRTTRSHCCTPPRSPRLHGYTAARSFSLTCTFTRLSAFASLRVPVCTVTICGFSRLSARLSHCTRFCHTAFHTTFRSHMVGLCRFLTPVLGSLHHAFSRTVRFSRSAWFHGCGSFTRCTAHAFLRTFHACISLWFRSSLRLHFLSAALDAFTFDFTPPHARTTLTRALTHRIFTCTFRLHTHARFPRLSLHGLPRFLILRSRFTPLVHFFVRPLALPGSFTHTVTHPRSHLHGFSSCGSVLVHHLRLRLRFRFTFISGLVCYRSWIYGLRLHRFHVVTPVHGFGCCLHSSRWFIWFPTPRSGPHYRVWSTFPLVPVCPTTTFGSLPHLPRFTTAPVYILTTSRLHFRCHCISPSRFVHTGYTRLHGSPHSLFTHTHAVAAPRFTPRSFVHARSFTVRFAVGLLPLRLDSLAFYVLGFATLHHRTTHTRFAPGSAAPLSLGSFTFTFGSVHTPGSYTPHCTTLFHTTFTFRSRFTFTQFVTHCLPLYALHVCGYVRSVSRT